MKKRVKSYEELEAWRYAMDLVVLVYEIAENFPPRSYRLGDQLCRAAVSIPSNIAEGSMRGSTKDYLRFVGISQGSLAEVETQLMIASRLSFTTPEKFSYAMDVARRVGRLLNGLYTALENKLTPATSHQHQPPS